MAGTPPGSIWARPSELMTRGRPRRVIIAGLRPPLDGARTSPILAAANGRRGSMRAARAAVRNRRLWGGLALGGVLAAVVVLVWNRASDEGEANARGSEPPPPKPIKPPPPKPHAAPPP